MNKEEHQRWLRELSALGGISRAGGEEGTDAELRERILARHNPPGLTRADVEHRIREAFGSFPVPLGLLFELDVRIDHPATPGTLRLIVRTETKWQRRWRLVKAWLTGTVVILNEENGKHNHD